MADAVHDAQRLKELQALPLHRKIQISQARIIEWYTRNKGNVVVSFSGGKDSTVLLHLVRSLFPDVKAVFSNTGLEFGEIQRFVRTFPNVDIVTPSMSFMEVISTYGYPLIGKEVAEAIYYARRIRSQSVQVEREREREQERRNAVETGRTLRLQENDGGSGIADENSSDSGHFIETSGAQNRRTILHGRWSGGGTWKPTGNGTTSPENIRLMDGRVQPRRVPKMGLAGPQTTFKRSELGGAELATENEALPGTVARLRTGNEAQARTGRVRETQSRGKWHDYHRRSLDPKDNPDDTECFFNRRTEWSDWRRGCL